MLGCSLNDFMLTKILKTSHKMAMIQILDILKHGIHQWNLHWAIWAGHLVDKVGIGGFGQVVGRQKGATAILLRYNKVSMLFITSHLARESFPFQIWVDCICFFKLLVLHISQFNNIHSMHYDIIGNILLHFEVHEQKCHLNYSIILWCDNGTRRKLVHYNRPLRLGHCNSCQEYA
jgi:hypothetical protein